MSKKHGHECCYDEKPCCKERDNCCCSFPTLVVLILIILQFNKHGHGLYGANAVEGVGNYNGLFGSDNSILFIIALFFLSCCNPCKR
ncbi:hypothetical protein JK636_08165 [Clostridium sp. YIM B02515]|uniref:Chorion class high-cysteine HCB protein 13 n=1 Tax=Clostridium rhizosphaerae TaxID=2803861 RepID=A0ABS1T8Q8_9CLOT|nr:hypothetical protein [Clostridium rhizosphaerae]MBL4935731.1 hypothetical protein [Clostridium rhizosphaerae]